jgi:hypothetical protein
MLYGHIDGATTAPSHRQRLPAWVSISGRNGERQAASCLDTPTVAWIPRRIINDFMLLNSRCHLPTFSRLMNREK